MSPYIETIRIQDGEVKNLPYHQARFDRTRHSELGLDSHPELYQIIRSQKRAPAGLVKCRITYGKEIEDVEFEPYTRRMVHSLKLVEADHISYAFKFSDRRGLDKLFAQREKCDDIVIIKNGCLTDSYLSNIVLWNGKGWFTPDTPLLPGTQRAYLLDQGEIEATRITLEDLNLYEKIKLINAMNDLKRGSEIPMERVS